jgi:hypothetical protein
MGSLFHGPKGYADGGEVEAMKQEGLKASADEKVGFFERLRAGNIDDPSSEAYRRFGAGRGQADRQENMRDAAMAEAFKSAKPEQTSEPETMSRQEKDAAYSPLDRQERDALPINQSKPKPAAKAAVKKTPERSLPDPNENQSQAETARLNRQAEAVRTPIKGKRNLGRAAERKRAE